MSVLLVVVYVVVFVGVAAVVGVAATVDGAFVVRRCLLFKFVGDALILVVGEVRDACSVVNVEKCSPRAKKQAENKQLEIKLPNPKHD